MKVDEIILLLRNKVNIHVHKGFQSFFCEGPEREYVQLHEP